MSASGDIVARFEATLPPAARKLVDRFAASSVGKAASLAYVIRIGNAAILFLTQVVLARWMGEFEYGIFVLVWTWVQLLGGMTTLGLDVGALRFVPEFKVAGDHERLRGVVMASRVFGFAMATAVALAGMALVVLLGERLESYYVLPFVVGFIALPMFTLTHIQDGIARSQDWIGIALLPPYIWRPLLLLGFMAGAWLAGAPATAATAVICLIAATWLSALWQFVALGRRFRRDVPNGPRKVEIGHWLRISAPMLLTQSFHVLMINTDVLVLGLLVSPAQLGIYYAAAKALALVSIVFFAAQAATGHRYAALHAAGDEAGLQRFVRLAAHWTFWLSLASAAGMLALGYPILWLFGPEFVAAYPVMFLLAVGILARASIGPAERLLNMIGEQDRCARIYLISLLTNVALNFLLVPIFGISGAATATSLALIVESLFLDRVVRETVGISAFVFAFRRVAKASV